MSGSFFIVKLLLDLWHDLVVTLGHVVKKGCSDNHGQTERGQWFIRSETENRSSVLESFFIFKLLLDLFRDLVGTLGHVVDKGTDADRGKG